MLRSVWGITPATQKAAAELGYTFLREVNRLDDEYAYAVCWDGTEGVYKAVALDKRQWRPHHTVTLPDRML